MGPVRGLVAHDAASAAQTAAKVVTSRRVDFCMVSSPKSQ